MAVRLSGLSSGLDTESIIKELMSVQSLKKTKVENKLTKLGWKEEKWKELNTKIYNLYKNELATLKTQSSYLTRSVTSSDSTKATFKASSSVPVGTHSLSISQVASSQFVTGTKVTATTGNTEGAVNTVEISNATKITSVKLKNGNGNESYIASGTVLNLTVGDKDSEYYTVNETTTISDLTNWFKSNNISFTYDSNNQKFFISSMQSGSDNAFTLTSTEDGIVGELGINYLSEKAQKDKVEQALKIYQYQTASQEEIAEAQKNIVIYGKANEDASRAVYRNYIVTKFELREDSYKELSLNWNDDGTWTISGSNSSDVLSDYTTKLAQYDAEYNFTEVMATDYGNKWYQEAYEISCDKSQNVLNSEESKAELKSGKTVGEIIGYTELDDILVKNKLYDALTYNVGGSYAFSALNNDGKANLEAALSAYKNGATEATKAEIEKYGQANYVAKKEVYKEYITNQWKDIIKDSKDISLTWDDEGNWSLSKTNEDSSISLATYRKKLNEAKSNYDYEKLMTSENSNYRDKYSAVYNDVLNKTYTTEKYGDSLILADNFSMHNTFTALEDTYSALDLLGIGEISSIPKDKVTTTAGATIVAGSNMICEFNGSEYKSSSNTLTINGLTINAIDKTNGTMKITVSNDTSAVYDKIKSFVSKYNEVLGEINELYYAGSAKGYDVLTDEEREAMSDEQIEKWENKIKDSLLRRDSTLSSVMSSLRSITSKSVTVNNKEYSLSTFGINTTDYTEKGLLHIYGDESDASVSSETDKLLAALSDDPDTVMQVLTGISSELYSTLSDKMSSTSLSSALTFYNDKEITSLKEDYQDEIDKWEDYLQELEDRYYSKFSAMETAMSKLNAQTSYISSLFSS